MMIPSSFIRPGTPFFGKVPQIVFTEAMAPSRADYFRRLVLALGRVFTTAPTQISRAQDALICTTTAFSLYRKTRHSTDGSSVLFVAASRSARAEIRYCGGTLELLRCWGFSVAEVHAINRKISEIYPELSSGPTDEATAEWGR